MAGCINSPPFYGIPASSPCPILNVMDISAMIVTPFVFGPSPPESFFNIDGIYSQRFVPPVQATFDSLYSYLKTVAFSVSGEPVPDPYNNPTNTSYVKHMSQGQRKNYQQQIDIFRKVYSYNLAAYQRAQQLNTVPIYYRFRTSSELVQFNGALGLINKLYNVNPLYPLQCLFWLPFPPFCG